MTSTRMRGCERARMRLISERRICDSDLFFARFTSHVCFSPRVAHCEPTCIWTLQSYRSAHARIGKSNRVRVLNALIVDVFAHVVSMLSTNGLSLSLVETASSYPWSSLASLWSVRVDANDDGFSFFLSRRWSIEESRLPEAESSKAIRRIERVSPSCRLEESMRA